MSFDTLQEQVGSFLDSLDDTFSSSTQSIDSGPGSGSISVTSEDSSKDGTEVSSEEVLSTIPFVSATLPLKNRRELGNYAQWTLSSAKASNGVKQLQSPDISLFWQSDGQYPHIVTLQFPKKFRIFEIALYLDHIRDESYTPLEIDVLAGTNERDVQLINSSCIEKPTGYVIIPTLIDEAVATHLTSTHSRNDKMSGRLLHPIFVAVIQVVIKSSHQNGKDIHVRNLSVLGAMPPRLEIGLPPGVNYSTDIFRKFAAIR